MTKSVSRVFAACLLLVSIPATAQDLRRFTEPNCGPIYGYTVEDITHLRRFCSGWQPTEPSGARRVEGAIRPGISEPGSWVSDGILTLKVNLAFATELLAGNRLEVEELMRGWMRRWKQASGYEVVSVYVDYRGSTVAEVQAGRNFDEVSIHRN